MPNSKKSIELYLNDILEAIENIQEYTNNMTYEEFIDDKKTKDAVVRNLEVIGEAVKNIPSNIKEETPSVHWKAIAGMRDKLKHEYFGISYATVWETIQNDLLPLNIGIKKLIKGDI